MPKSDYQKARLFAVYQILKRYTDETHGITMREILNKLENDYEITSTRQTIASDLALLQYPLNIEWDTSFEMPQKYSLLTRDLSFDDIKTIVDSVSSNVLISKEQKSNIIKTIQKNLCSVSESKEIQLKSIPLGMDETTLNTNYFRLLNFLKKAVENKDTLSFDYPLCGYCFPNPEYPRIVPYDSNDSDTAGYLRVYFDHYDDALPLFIFTFKHKGYLCACKVTSHYNRWIPSQSLSRPWRYSIQCFEIENIKNLSICAITDGKVSLPNSEDIEEALSNHIIPIFVTRNEEIVMEFENSLYLFALNYFQDDLNVVQRTKKTFQVKQNVEISPDFFGWLFSLGSGAKLLAPELTVNQMKHWVNTLSELYQSPSKPE